MNHGIPAAGSEPSPLRIRSEARSATERENEWCRSSQLVRSCGTRSFQAVSDSRTCTSSSPKRRSTARGASWSPSRSAWTSTRTAQRARGSRSIRQQIVAPSTSPRSERITCVRAALSGSTNRNWLSPSSNTGVDRGRQRLGRLRIAEREVVVLDGEDVREVGAEAERELERDRLHGVVLDAEVILHSHADEALARDREHVRRQLRARVAQVERGREVLDPVGREQERPLAVDRELEDGEEADVLGEEPARRPAEVSAGVADAECRSLEDRQRHATRPVLTSSGGFDPRSTARAPSPRARRRSRGPGG